jgi:hypothetical protein
MERDMTTIQKIAAIAGLIATSMLLIPLAASARGTQLPVAIPGELRQTYGISVDEFLAPTPQVSAEHAVDVATKAFAWSGGGPASPHLVVFTDPHHGSMNPDGHITPTWVTKPAWLVVIPNTKHFVLGPARQTYVHVRHSHVTAGRTRDTPRTFIATLCVFIDAETGQLLEAATVKG